MVFFTNSGTEANELALMMAKLFTGHQDIVSIRNGYHGNAVGTMGATGQSMWKFSVVQVLKSFCFLNLDSNEISLFLIFGSLFWLMDIDWNSSRFEP